MRLVVNGRRLKSAGVGLLYCYYYIYMKQSARGYSYLGKQLIISEKQ